MEKETEYMVSALYRFVKLPDYKEIQPKLLQFMQENNIKGSILIAEEGVNGTIAGSQHSVKKLIEYLRLDARLLSLTHKDSFTTEMPFSHCRVKLKKEIVTMGVEGLDPEHVTGTYVNAKDWNKLLSDPEVLVIDTRNEYEIMTGTFQNSINPHIDSFPEFPGYVNKELDKDKHKKVAMFCTGGIRCEKSTALLKQLGFEDVYHLEGGILKYLEEVPQKDSKWEGECFVFDTRVTVDHNLEQGKYDKCFACRRPITEDEKKSEKYEIGVSCHHCYDDLTEKQKAAFIERAKQYESAKKRNQIHIGQDSKYSAYLNKEMNRKKREARKAKNAEKPEENNLLKKESILTEDNDIVEKKVKSE